MTTTPRERELKVIALLHELPERQIEAAETAREGKLLPQAGGPEHQNLSTAIRVLEDGPLKKHAENLNSLFDPKVRLDSKRAHDWYESLTCYVRNSLIRSVLVPVVCANDETNWSEVVDLRVHLMRAGDGNAADMAYPHPAYEMTYFEAPLNDDKRSYNNAFKLALNSTHAESGRYVGYWRFEKEGKPLVWGDSPAEERSRPWGDSATGAAFFAWAWLLQRRHWRGRLTKTLFPRPPIDDTVLLALVREGQSSNSSIDLAAFHDEKVLQLKAEAIAKTENISRVIVADKEDAKVVANALAKSPPDLTSKDATRRAISVLFPG